MRVIGALTRSLMLLAMLAAAPHADTEEPVVLSVLPGIGRVDVESGVKLQYQMGALTAYDLDSGATRWTLPIPQGKNKFKVGMGLHHTVLFSDSGQLRVIDNQTGKETHRLNVSAGQEKLIYASLSMNGQWIDQLYDQHSVLLELATRRQFQFPLRGLNKTIGGRWMPDGKTFLFTEVLSGDAPPTRAQVWFWEVGVSDPVPGAVLESPLRMYVSAVLPGGELLLHEYDPKADANAFYRVVNAATGATLRAFEESGTSRIWPGCTEDGTLWYDFEDSSNSLRVKDTISGEDLFSVKMSGERTACVRPQPYEAGKHWIIAWEENKNAWLVPLEKDAVPLKLLDGSPYLPGIVTKIVPPNMLCDQIFPTKDRRTITLYSIAGMKKVREWAFAGWNISEAGLTADQKKLLVRAYSRKNGETIRKTVLLAAGDEAPESEMDDDPLLLSPDGRHILLRRSRNQVILARMDNGEGVRDFSSEERHDADVAAFSPDSRRVAVFDFPKLIVVDLEDGYSDREMALPKDERVQIINRNSLCFSPDGTLLLGAGYGRAWLFNALTGEHLRTFIEEGRFAQPHQYRGGGFFNTLEGMASDYVGMVTDRYKSQPQLTCAFTMDGLRAVTVAQSQAARVWDVRTGAKVAAFITGLPETRNKSGMIDNRHVLSANGAYLFAYNADGYGTASLWETASGRKIKEYRIPEGVELAAIADDGRAVYVKIGEDLHILPGRAN